MSVLINPYRFAAAPSAQTMLQMLTALGLDGDNLRLCLDAGDSNSWSGSGKWSNTANASYNFNRGTTSSSQTSDPTFNGSVGGKSSNEYWGFDGGDCFQYDTTGNPSWAQQMHKDGALFTAIAMVYGAGSDVNNSLFGTSGNDDFQVGVMWRAAASDGSLQFKVNSGTGSHPFTGTSGNLGYAADRWQLVSLVVDEANTDGFMGVDGSFYDMPDLFYVEPVSGDADYTIQLGSRGNLDTPFTSGGRMAIFCVWDIALTKNNITDIRAKLRSRFA